jgi:hypothetical protein
LPSWPASPKTTLPQNRVPWGGLIANYDRIRCDIASVFSDFGDFNMRIRVPGGFPLSAAMPLQNDHFSTWTTATGACSAGATWSS